MLRAFAVLLLALTAGPAIAETRLWFDAHQNTWSATHIIVTEGGKVVESWHGDLKPGDPLPAGVLPFTKLPVPPVWQSVSAPPGQKPPAVSGQRMVLFLAFVTRQGGDPKKPEWHGADSPGRPFDGTSDDAVAWVEGDAVYKVEQPEGPTGSASFLGRSGTVAGLRQQVDLGLALKAQFVAAQADPDPARRAERVAVLAPTLNTYVYNRGMDDAIRAVGRCGPAGIPHLLEWVRGADRWHASEAVAELCRLGDPAADAIAELLDEEAAHWRRVAGDLKPSEVVREPRRPDEAFFGPLRGPSWLHSLLSAVHGMKLSPAVATQIANHPGLKELDRLMDTHPGMKPAGSDLARASELLKDVRAGRFRPGE